MKNLWRLGKTLAAAAALSVLTAAYPAVVAAQSLKIFGHDVVVHSVHKTVGEEIIDRETLLVDKKALLKDRQMYIWKTGSFGGVGFTVGMHSSGAMCDNNFFVLIFPPDGPPRVNGVIQACALRYGIESDSVVFETIGNAAGEDPDLRFRWVWTTNGFGPKQHFKVKTGSVERLLQTGSIKQPAELLEHSEFAGQFDQLAESSHFSSNTLFEIIKGPGDIRYEKGFMFGRACQAGECATGSLLVAVDIKSKKLYLAIKTGDKPVIISPRQKTWPPAAQSELRLWESN